MNRTPDFDALYRSDPDPFSVGSNWYERRKIAVVLASLARHEYALAWDAAAGTGHLALELSARCHRVVATDASAVAVAALSDQATEVCSEEAADDFPFSPEMPGTGRLTVRQSALPTLPAEARAADLVIVSEVLYYLPGPARAATVQMLFGLDAEIVTVHWRHHPEDAYLSGEDCTREVDVALTAAGFFRAVLHEDRDFVLSTHLPASTPPRELP
ncbi:methyltransferase [Citricoccus zhacaiensis]|uniref:Methyltransferase n=1 Tax=Citricoccus zhacaiensis TaxID=489142 RepID=A0ABQ2M033_9MICC|nr:methyltransferase domain-containing protein [Citricoccus zhacaiensis]GGO45278.1 methyltransferase [Citricoccus zhacaiensis]